MSKNDFDYDLAIKLMKKKDSVDDLQKKFIFPIVKLSQIQNQEIEQEYENLQNRIMVREFLYGNNNKKANIKPQENSDLQQFLKKQQNEKNQQKRYIDQSFDEHKSNDSNNEDSFDEEMILEQVICSENEEEMKQFIEINELKYNIINPNYKKLYLALKKKAILLMKVLKKNISKESKNIFEEQNKQLQGELDRYKNVYTTLSQKLLNLNRKHMETEYKYEQLKEQLQKNIDIEYKYEQLKEELQKTENENKMLAESDHINFDLQEIMLLEKKAQDRIAQITKKKNEMIEHLQKKLKNQNDSNKALCSICYIAPIDCLLQPCNHACCCYNCAQILDDCPMDRSLVTNIKRIYLG